MSKGRKECAAETGLTLPSHEKRILKKDKMAAFQRAGGRCEKCGSRLMAGTFEYDHDLPCSLGGEASLGN